MRPSFRRIARSLGGLAVLGGTLLVTASPARADSASDEATLRSKFADGSVSEITIDANIDLTNCGSGAVTRASNNPITVSAGAGTTIHQTCAAAVFNETGTAALTFSGLTLTGAPNNDVVSSGSGTVTLSGTTLNGFDGGDGISNTGDIVMTDSSISGVNGGNGVNTGGTTTMTNSSINDVGDGNGFNGTHLVMIHSSINDVGDGGNGVNGSDATLTDSSVTGDPAGDCDAVNVGDATLTRSTVFGCARGINTGNVTLTNSTVTGAGTGLDAGTVTLVFSDVVGNGDNINSRTVESTGSVVAKATSGANCDQTVHTSHGFNFDDDGTCGFDQSTDQSNAGDPGLGALADNGGPTKTLLPQAGSKLLDKVPAVSCSVSNDQRGTTRPQGDGCEVGSVEISVATPAAPPAEPVAVQPSTLTG